MYSWGRTDTLNKKSSEVTFTFILKLQDEKKKKKSANSCTIRFPVPFDPIVVSYFP